MPKALFICSLTFMVLLQQITFSQQFSLSILPADSNSMQNMKRLNYNARPAGPVNAHKELNKVLQYFYSKGYLTASIDSLKEDSLALTAWLYTGDTYTLSMIRPGNANRNILAQSGYKERFYSGKPFNGKDITRLAESILRYCENNGYPFASVQLDSIRIEPDNSISASLKLDIHHQVTIDTLMVKGSSNLHIKFITNYLRIKAGDLYNEARIMKMERRLGELPYLQMIRLPEVAFMDDKAKIILYLDKQRASQFDGIIGIAPNETTSGGLLLTGDVKLKLLNALNRGELIDFNWRKLEAQSQDLNIHLNYPFLFSTPFGFDYKLQLFKKDTSYLTLSNNLGIQVLFNGNNHVMAFYENQRSNLLSSEGLESVSTLPEYADVTSNMYGLQLNYSRLDYRFNPRRGYRMDFSGSTGNRKIRKNDDIKQELYEGIPLSSNIYKLRLNAQLFIPLFMKTTFMIGNKSGYLENKNLFSNELFRIGGLKSLRGFDEEAITASLYSIITFEFRFLFDRNSFFQLFFDGAFYERNLYSGYMDDTPYGLGAGVSFETRAGIFNLSYALGSGYGQTLQFKTAKVHFGMTARF
jgi:outer membrane protein assembly factor BamA